MRYEQHAALAEVAYLDAVTRRERYWATVVDVATETYSDRLAHLIRRDLRPDAALLRVDPDVVTDIWRHYMAMEG